MKVTKPTAATGPRGVFFVVLLAVLLAVLFGKSFLPGYVLFSNDGPLGVQNSAWLWLPQALTGQWYDLNSIGENAGQSPPDFVTLCRFLLGPVGYSKFFAPISLWTLGVSAWFFFRQLKFSRLASALGGMSAMLISIPFSDACWGFGSHEIGIGMDFCALGLVFGNDSEPSAFKRGLRLIMAGLAVGINVMEAADVGAILSVFVALFVFFHSLIESNGAIAVKAGRGILRVAVIAAFAGIIAVQTVTALIGTSITGISGTGQDAETKARQWDFATQWSLPKAETLTLFVPGLFGYRMDTPQNMIPSLQNAYKGGNYWGGVGRTPAIDRYFDGGGKNSPPPGIMRFSGTGYYIGILVALIAAWAIAQSFRHQNSVFTLPQRKFIWLGATILIISLLLSWGRFAPFYQFFYALPYASTIRDPGKFIIVFWWVAAMLFGYGVQGLSKLYLPPVAAVINPRKTPPKNWWARAGRFDRNWTLISLAVLGVSIAGWGIYASNKPALISYLGMVGFPDPDLADEMASFSIGQVGWFILFFALAVVLLILVIAGVFSGKRARLGGILLGALLVADLGRADLPWIIPWNYIQKYEVGTLNPVVKYLTDKPYEHRVAQLPFPAPQGLEVFNQLYDIEWMQHLFPYLNIQSLDKVQMPREPADLEAFERTFLPHSVADVSLFTRFWQLTDTRYLLGPAGFLDVMNSQLDPEQRRFHIAMQFDVVPKPDVDIPADISPEQYVRYLPPEKQTARVSPNGQYALFDFTGALPRAKLYAHWATNGAAELKSFTTNGLSAEDLYVLGEAGTNGFLTLKKLASPEFHPEQTVLLDAPLPEANPTTNENSGAVEYKSYAPTKIVLMANAEAPSVLLLNDKYDPSWHATVDGKPAPLFHANFIMRGVFIPAGQHTVEFQFHLPLRPLYITSAAIGLGIVLIGILIFYRRRPAGDHQAA